MSPDSPPSDSHRSPPASGGWSGRGRWLGLLLGLLAVVFLGLLYAHDAETQVVGYRTCLTDPERYDGLELSFPLWDVTAIHPDSYEIGKSYGGVPVDGSPEGLAVGDVVSVAGAFRASDRSIVESFRMTHPYRRWKQALSTLGVLLGLLYLPFAFRIHDREIVERG
jgi:hypothetical protein